MILKGLGEKEKLRLGGNDTERDDRGFCVHVTPPPAQGDHSWPLILNLVFEDSCHWNPSGAETVLNSYLLNELTWKLLSVGLHILISNVFDLMWNSAEKTFYVYNFVRIYVFQWLCSIMRKHLSLLFNIFGWMWVFSVEVGVHAQLFANLGSWQGCLVFLVICTCHLQIWHLLSHLHKG